VFYLKTHPNKVNITMINKDELVITVKESNSFIEVAKKLNKSGGPNIKRLCLANNIDTSHFTKKRVSEITKTCPVCKKQFTGLPCKVKNKKTCSYACSNKFFRTGEGNGNWKKDAYRSTCFLHHKKECIICGENKIVTVHHYDENHKNNSPENLVPLCPTHHQYYHSKFRKEVEKKIDTYINNFISKRTNPDIA